MTQIWIIMRTMMRVVTASPQRRPATQQVDEAVRKLLSPERAVVGPVLAQPPVRPPDKLLDLGFILSHSLFISPRGHRPKPLEMHLSLLQPSCLPKCFNNNKGIPNGTMQPCWRKQISLSRCRCSSSSSSQRRSILWPHFRLCRQQPPQQFQRRLRILSQHRHQCPLLCHHLMRPNLRSCQSHFLQRHLLRSL